METNFEKSANLQGSDRSYGKTQPKLSLIRNEKLQALEKEFNDERDGWNKELAEFSVDAQLWMREIHSLKERLAELDGDLDSWMYDLKSHFEDIRDHKNRVGELSPESQTEWKSYLRSHSNLRLLHHRIEKRQREIVEDMESLKETLRQPVSYFN